MLLQRVFDNNVKINMKYIILIGACIYTSFFASAAVYIEPYLGGGFAYSRIGTTNDLRSSSLIFTGWTLGGRLGVQWLNLKTGLDIFHNRYNMSNSFRMPSVIVHNPNVSRGFNQAGESVSIQYSRSRNNFNPTSIGLFGIFDIPFITDIYGTAFYSFGNKDTIFYHGPGVKAGLSYLSAFFAQFNLELQWAHYFCRRTECLQSRGFNLWSIMFLVSVPFSTKLFSFAKNSTDDDLTNSSMEENTIESTDIIESSDVIENTNTITNDL